MRYTQDEKLEIIRLVEVSDLPTKTTLEQLQVSRASFYRWCRTYVEHGVEGLAPKPSSRRQFWNRMPDPQRERVVEVALEKPELSARELAWHITDNEGWFISERSVYRILKACDLVTSPAYIVMSVADEFKHKTSRVHELWQTDFTYFKTTGWGWYYLSTVLDDYSRYIISWRRTYYQKEELERELRWFVEYYNNERVHESLNNVTPADLYCGCHHEVLAARQRLKMRSLRRRRCYNQGYDVKDEELIRPSLIRECVY